MNRHIPNFITLLNLLCGSVAVLFAVQGHMVFSAFFVFLGIFFDFFDGLVARKLNVESELGLQLDSLADMVTSGLVPGIIMYKLLEISVGQSISILDNDWNSSFSLVNSEFSMIPLFGLLITLASAYRLATFNVSDNQSDSFIGLPTPANALLILSLPMILEFQNNDIINSIIMNPWFLILITLISCFLLNAKVKLLALKFSNWSFKDNSARYILIIISAILLIIFKFAGIPLIILLYIIISLLNK